MGENGHPNGIIIIEDDLRFLRFAAMLPSRRVCRVDDLFSRERGRFEEALMAEPVGAGLRPGRARMVAGADAEVVGGGGVDVQLRRDAGFPQGQVHEHAMLRRADDVGPAVCEEHRRSPRRDVLEVGSDLVLVLVLGLEVSGIDANGKVGPAACFV